LVEVSLQALPVWTEIEANELLTPPKSSTSWHSVQGSSPSAQHASFMKEGFVAGQELSPLFHDPFDILGMDERGPLSAL
jgi:hypothetical protein